MATAKKTVQFFSDRIKEEVILTFVIGTNAHVSYLTNSGKEYIIKKDLAWHPNEDGLNRAIDYFNDPRFEKFYQEDKL